MTETNTINRMAIDLLHDLEVVYSRARPDTSRRRFPDLQPHYAYAREGNVVDRIAVALDHLDPEGKLHFQMAVIEALQRCIQCWLGSTRTINVAMLAYRVAREFLPSNVWERLLDRRDPDSINNTAAFLEQLIPLLRSWRVELDASKVKWDHVIQTVPLHALPATGEWILRQSSNDVALSQRNHKRISARLEECQAELLRYGLDPDDVDDRMFRAFLPQVPDSERASLLGRGVAPQRLSVIRAALEVWVHLSRADESEEDLLYECALVEG